MVLILLSPQPAISATTSLSVDDLCNKKAAILPIKTATEGIKSLLTIAARKKVKIKTNNDKKHDAYFFYCKKKLYQRKAFYFVRWN